MVTNLTWQDTTPLQTGSWGSELKAEQKELRRPNGRNRITLRVVSMKRDRMKPGAAFGTTTPSMVRYCSRALPSPIFFDDVHRDRSRIAPFAHEM